MKPKLPTPDLDHLPHEIFDKIYEPREDTFLLLDALEKDEEKIKSMDPKICMEIGCASGCVITFLAKMIDKNIQYLSTDINPFALPSTRETFEKNKCKGYLDVVNCDLLNPFSIQMHKMIDVIIFNAPYVPTTEEELNECKDKLEDKLIYHSWAGGKDGMQVTNKLLPHINTFLSPNGFFYLVAIEQNDPTEIIERMHKEYGFSCEIVLKRRARNESLSILRFQKTNNK